jgi:hypothetical protein
MIYTNMKRFEKWVSAMRAYGVGLICKVGFSVEGFEVGFCDFGN